MKNPDVCLPGSNYSSPLKEFGLLDIENRISVSVLYKLPDLKAGYKFQAKFLKDAQAPPLILKYEDLATVRGEFDSRGRQNTKRMPRIYNSGLRLVGQSKDQQQMQQRYKNKNERKLEDTYLGGGGYANRDYQGKIQQPSSSSKNPYSNAPDRINNSKNPYLNSQKSPSTNNNQRNQSNSYGAGYKPNLPSSSSHGNSGLVNQIYPADLPKQSSRNTAQDQLAAQIQLLTKQTKPKPADVSNEINDLLSMLPSKK